MIKRTYLKGCDWCGATGKVHAGYPLGTTVLEDTCPVCQGSGTITVTEEDTTESINRFSVYNPVEATFKVDGEDLVGILKKQSHGTAEKEKQ
jgi:DnaJ-class molecular chaperone